METILKASSSDRLFGNLLVGNDSNDDAAVYDIGGGQAIISTTDFFTPIVDDPVQFGKIASTNALSDVYAMGGRPLMALAVLAWPLDKLPAEIAGEVIRGAREVCDAAGIPLAGGHSINASDPVFGLAVTGIVASDKVKKNNSAKAGDILYITKPLGSGIVSTAQKFDVAREEDVAEAIKVMSSLNVAGAELSEIEGVSSLTDVTGFGLGGHLLEMTKGSGVNAVVEYASLPKISGVDYYISQECVPGGTHRNFSGYGELIRMSEDKMPLICDPQTSGGLLISAREDVQEQIRDIVEKSGQKLYRIGFMKERTEGDPVYIEVR